MAGILAYIVSSDGKKCCTSPAGLMVSLQQVANQTRAMAR